MPKSYPFNNLTNYTTSQILHSLYNNKSIITNSIDDNNTFALDLELTQQCNFRCKYCIERGFYNNNIMKPHIINEVINKIDYILYNDKTKYANKIVLGLWGGEPTLNNSAINTLCNYYMNNNKVYFQLFTNGLLLHLYYDLIDNVNRNTNNDDDKYVNSGRYRFNTQISYDGLSIHNNNRLFNNNSTGDKIREVIIESAKKGIPFNLKSTITYDDLDKMYESYLDICDLHDECIHYNLKHQISYAPTLDYSLITYDNFNEDNIIEIKKILEEKLILIANNEYKRFKQNKAPIFSWFNDFYKDNVSKRSLCGGGNKYKCVSYNGDILTCHGCTFTKNPSDHYIAHITDKNKVFVDKMRKSDRIYYNGCFNSNKESLEPNECLNCDSTICYACNSIKYELSNKSLYTLRWLDTNVQPILCDFYKMASNIHAALKLRYKIDKFLYTQGR